MLAAAALACGDAEPKAAGGDPAVERGRTVYMSICTACHNADPKLDGAVGPANAGASRELVEAKVLRGQYPPGYTPKRPSNVMPPLPHLAGSIDDLTAFLAASAK
ncbi:MAG TPA: c-type cytochrome [Myxococcota bacterium]|nr:c-type cytochrome [Myxococcota bacterium]